MPSGSFSQSMVPEATQLHSGRLRGLPGPWAGRGHRRLTTDAVVTAGPPPSWAFGRFTNTENNATVLTVFLGENTVTYHEHMLYVLTWNGFMIVTIK